MTIYIIFRISKLFIFEKKLRKNYFNYTITLLVFSLTSFLCTQEKLHDKNSKKPNFLFVLVDDQPFDAIGYSKR